MSRLKSDDYHDYVIKDGRLVGAFDEMYQDHADPWGCNSHSSSFDNDLFLAALRRVAPSDGTLLDLGCGLGALTARIRDEVPKISHLIAMDISSDAIAKAQVRWNTGRERQIDFRSVDLRHPELSLPSGLDIVSFAQLVWYILPEFEAILGKVRQALRPGAYVVVLQSFLPRDQQKYGKEYISRPTDLTGFITRAGFRVEAEVLIGATPPNNLLLIGRKAL